jgi:hypothetical protein
VVPATVRTPALEIEMRTVWSAVTAPAPIVVMATEVVSTGTVTSQYELGSAVLMVALVPVVWIRPASSMSPW